MPLDLAVVMDPIESITVKKDSTFALLLEAQRRGHRLQYVMPGSLGLDGGVGGLLAPLVVRDDPADWFSLDEPAWRPLAGVRAVLMRRDPPVDAGYLHDTFLLSLAQREGCAVVNDPQGLRDMNEKLYTLHFPQCCPPSVLSRDPDRLRAFVLEQRDCVLKPLDGMGGRSIFRGRADDDNLKVIIETLTRGGSELITAQRYIPEISEGDKRILLVDGEPVPYALARIPQPGDFRGNLAVGGVGEARLLSERDRWIAAQVGPEMRRRGMLLVGLDVIGDYLTEVNVTSPTCLRELDALCGLNIAGGVLDALEARLG
jgi:glutathione synthase